MNQTNYRHCVLSAVLLCAIHPQYTAANPQLLPGNACHTPIGWFPTPGIFPPAEEATLGEFDRSFYGLTNVIADLGFSPYHAVAFCPIPRRQPTRTHGAQVQVSFFNPYSGPNREGFTCRFDSVQAVAPGYVAFRDEVESREIGFGRIVLSLPRSTFFGPYQLLCIVPSEARIISYSIHEH